MPPVDNATPITLEVRDYIGIITINRPNRLNAMTEDMYIRVASLLNELASNPDTYITLVTAKGSFFSAGADVQSIDVDQTTGKDPNFWPRAFYQGLSNTSAWYNHPKILVTALNGPVVGISAAFIAHSDFVFAAPHAYIMVPFASLGLLPEGGASRVFVERMGRGMANEVLLMGKRIGVERLVNVGFVQEVIEEGSEGADAKGKGFDDGKFLEGMLKRVEERLGGHLVRSSLLRTKVEMRSGDRRDMDSYVLQEARFGIQNFAEGIPQREIAKIAKGEKRHKL